MNSSAELLLSIFNYFIEDIARCYDAISAALGKVGFQRYILKKRISFTLVQINQEDLPSHMTKINDRVNDKRKDLYHLREHCWSDY